MISDDPQLSRLLELSLWKFWTSQFVAWLFAMVILWVSVRINAIDEIPVSIRSGQALTAVKALVLTLVFWGVALWGLMLTKRRFSKDLPTRIKAGSLSISIALLVMGGATLVSAVNVYSLVGWRDISS